MLKELTIENVAVIEKATVGFDKGFNVLTGETGAGKSILIDSINMILGNRTSRDIVRTGAQKARVWAVFEDLGDKLKDKLDQDGYTLEDGELLLYREISADGKSTCRIAGSPATAAYLREICEGLIDIHGQHDNQTLLNPAKHLGILDAFAKNDDLRAAYYQRYRELVTVEKELRSMVTDEREKQAKIELLRYQIDEIEAAQLRPGEEEELMARRSKYQNSQKITDALGQAYEALAGNYEEETSGAVDALAQASSAIEEIVPVYGEISQASEKLNDIYYTSQDLAVELKNALDSFEIDPKAVEELEERLDLFYRLKQKYGKTAEEILHYCETAKADLEKIEFSDEYMEKLHQKRDALLKDALSAAQALTESRTRAFRRLQQELQDTLDFLNMPGVSFSLHHDLGALTSSGQDSVEFYIVTNRGEQPKPLARIASGGELSRIMLAIKSALADSDEIGTVIYDEIDAGVSGMAAGRIGQKLQQTSRSGHQIICVTHTAQIAAAADAHLLIKKSSDDKRTYTDITPLDAEGRVAELARIISGDKVTDLSLAGAREMLELSARKD